MIKTHDHKTHDKTNLHTKYIIMQSHLCILAAQCPLSHLHSIPQFFRSFAINLLALPAGESHFEFSGGSTCNKLPHEQLQRVAQHAYVVQVSDSLKGKPANVLFVVEKEIEEDVFQEARLASVKVGKLYLLEDGERLSFAGDEIRQNVRKYHNLGWLPGGQELELIPHVLLKADLKKSTENFQ